MNQPPARRSWIRGKGIEDGPLAAWVDRLSCLLLLAAGGAGYGVLVRLISNMPL